MREQPLPAAPLPQSPARATWGLGEAALALVITYLIAVLFTSGYDAAATGLEKRDYLMWEIVGYQWLVAGIIGAVIFLILRRPGRDLAMIGFRFPGWRVMLTAAGSVPVIVIALTILTVLFDTLLPGYHLKGNASDILRTGASVPLPEQTLALLWAAIEAPLAEETLFRGIIFQGLRETLLRFLPRNPSIAVAAVTSGLLFGLVHGEIHTLPILAFLGIALALIFQYARSVYASALVHGIFNGIAVIVTFHS
jgi:membrane protease YdiL (CAAX protease family)